VSAFARRHRTDIVVAAVLALAAGVTTAVLALALDPRFLDWTALDVWFESDPPRVLESLASRWSATYVNRTQIHPLFLLFVFPPVQALRWVAGIELATAVATVLAINATLWAATFHVTFRLLRLARLDAAVFTLLAFTSAAGLFWLGMPETYPFASLTVVFALLLVAAGSDRLRSPAWDIAAGVLTFGVTVTNWGFAILATLSRRTIRGAIAICALVFVLVSGLWYVQHAVFPSTQFFLGEKNQENFMFAPESGGVARVAASFFTHTIVAPAIHVVERPGEREYPIMRTQLAAPGSNGIGLAAVGIWIVLLGAGTATALREPRLRRAGIVATVAIGGQLALHVAFGHETFLYSLDFAPVLLFLAAMAALSRWRRAFVTLAIALVLIGGWNNARQYARAKAFFDRVEGYRHDAGAMMDVSADAAMAPRDLVRLHDPGTGMLRQPVHSLGGGFSPALYRFSVSIHVIDAEGNVLATSGTVDEAVVAERRIFEGDSSLTAIETTTPYWAVRWAVDGPSRRSLDLDVPPDGTVIQLVLRGTGTQDGALRVVERVENGVLANERWALTCAGLSPADVALDLDSGNLPPAQTPAQGVPRVSSDAGWAIARLSFQEPGTHHCRLDDLRAGQGIERFLFILE
jgi:hypothetical protein